MAAWVSVDSVDVREVATPAERSSTHRAFRLSERPIEHDFSRTFREPAGSRCPPGRAPRIASLALTITMSPLSPPARSRLSSRASSARCARLRRRAKYRILRPESPNAHALRGGSSNAGLAFVLLRSDRHRPKAASYRRAASEETASPAPFPHVAAPRRALPAALLPKKEEQSCPFEQRARIPRPFEAEYPGHAGPTAAVFEAANAGQDASSRNQQTTDASRHPHLTPMIRS